MLKKIQYFYNHTSLSVFTFIIIGLLAFGSSLGDSLTVDESPHIAAGYSYVTQGDYRLNPEHPPLLKLLSGLSIWIGGKLTGQNFYFPTDIPAWTERVNAQWDMGYSFLFQAGNDANTIIWWARLPTILIFLLGAIYLAYSVYYHTKNKAISLIALILYAFSPNVIAHARLVTTDLIASLAFLLVIDIWIRYLKLPNYKHILYLTLALGLAFVSKFSTILLIPVLFVSGLGFIIFKNWKSKSLVSSLIQLCRDICVVAIGVSILISCIYYIPMRNMSIDTQSQLIQDSFIEDNSISNFTKSFLDTTIRVPGLQYMGQYLLGQAMVVQRVGGGNTTFLIGKFTNQSFIEYFPITYLLKEHLIVIILLFSSIMVGSVLLLNKIRNKSLQLKPKELLKYWYEITIIMMICLYWLVSIKGNLNLGIRHILPIVILTYIIIAIATVRFIIPMQFSRFLLGVFFMTYILANLYTYPSYISSLNILAGFNQGYQIFTDSNLDWGQDLKRLNNWTKQKNIDTLYIDYFGTGDVQYYLPNTKIIPVKSTDGPKIGYTAISATMLQDSFYKKTLDPAYQEYWWLAWRNPDYIIGNSILIYYNDNY